MKSFVDRLKGLDAEACKKIVVLIENKGTESHFSSNLSLKITDDDCMFNLDGGRYLVEVRKADRYDDDLVLIDNSGYTYNPYILSNEDWFAVCDHLIKSYSKKKRLR
jgi:hypothetical protein